MIRQVFRKTVTIQAHGRVIKGMLIDGGGNIAWNGGRIEAPAGSGEDPKQGGAQYYGVQIKGQSRSIAFDGVGFTNARKAIVFSGPAQGLTVRNSRCDGNVEDCLIASGGQDIVFTHNVAGPFVTKPSLCVVGAFTFDRLPKRDCLARSGEWRSGWHTRARKAPRYRARMNHTRLMAFLEERFDRWFPNPAGKSRANPDVRAQGSPQLDEASSASR